MKNCPKCHLPVSEHAISCFICGTNLQGYYEKERKDLILFLWCALFVLALAVGQFFLGAWLWTKGMKILGGLVFALCAMCGLGAATNLVYIPFELSRNSRELAFLRNPARRYRR